MMENPPATEPVWTIRRLLAWTIEYFTRNGVEEPRLSAEVLLAKAMGTERIHLYARPEMVPGLEELTRFRGWVARTARHEPVAYLIGEKEFFSLAFEVSRDVLVPRSETETLVEALIDHCRGRSLDAPRLLDVGTGSGCVVVAALSQMPGATATATDVSSKALELAGRNARRHHVADRVKFVLADRLNLPEESRPEGGFDIMVSNPPYVSAAEVLRLAPSVRQFEPRAALTDESDGLSFYRCFASDAPAWLAPSGVLLVEVGDGQADVVTALMEQAGRFVRAAAIRDRVVGRERTLLFVRAGDSKPGKD